MFVPLHDSTPLKVIRFQAVTITIIALNVVMYLSTGAFNSEAVLQTIATGWGVVPGELTHSTSVAVPYHPVPEPFTLISYMFLHAGWWHLISNMLFLWVFGNNIEDAMGHGHFILFYLTCGVLGAYLLLYPKARVLLALPPPLIFFTIGWVRAVWVLAAWFIGQVAMGWFSGMSGGGVALGAHIGGFVAGMLLIPLFKDRHVPLWRNH